MTTITEETVDRSIANELSAGLSGVSAENYVDAHEAMLKQRASLWDSVRKAKVTSLAEYVEAMKLKGTICSLTCYTFNNKKPEDDEIWKMEAVLGKKLYSFCLRQRARPNLRKLLRYVLWSHYFFAEDLSKIVSTLNAHSLLRRCADGSYAVIGLHLATGDNVFGIARNGREYRRYVRTCQLQAYHLPPRFSDAIAQLNLEPPLLDDEIYTMTSIADRKYCARISFSREDRTTIRREFCI